MNEQQNDDKINEFMAGWPGLVTGLALIVWMLLVVNDFIPGLKGWFGRWWALVDFLPGFFSCSLVAFGILGEKTWVGTAIRYGLGALVIAVLLYSCVSGGSGGGACTRATPQFC